MPKQWVLLPLALIVSAVLPYFSELVSQPSGSRVNPCVAVTPVRVTGWREGPTALCPRSDAAVEGALNVSEIPRCFLFYEGERPIVWLGHYKLAGCKAYGSRQTGMLLLLERGGQGEAYELPALNAGSEVYAMVAGRGESSFIPLLRVVGNGSLFEISGSAKGASRVEVFAYAAAEDFNASLPPIANLYVTEGEVASGKYLIRIERGGAPFTPQGRPLLDINSTLVLYTGCSYAVIDLANCTSTKLSVTLDCRRERQAP